MQIRSPILHVHLCMYVAGRGYGDVHNLLSGLKVYTGLWTQDPSSVYLQHTHTPSCTGNIVREREGLLIVQAGGLT